MVFRRWRLSGIASALAFVATIAIGIGVGCMLTVGESIEDKLRGGKRQAAKQTHDRG